MGCGCIASQLKDKYTIEDIISTKYNSSQKEIISTYPLSSYVKKVFYLINKIRTNPSEFIKNIICNIILFNNKLILIYHLN